MVILRTRNKITDFLMILAWASPFNSYIMATPIITSWYCILYRPMKIIYVYAKCIE